MDQVIEKYGPILLEEEKNPNLSSEYGVDRTESLKNLYALSEQRFDKIQQIIIEGNTAIAKPSDSPVVIILGAQPSAGKTELERIARAELGGNIINCNADLMFRDYYPDVHEMKSRFESYYPSLTNRRNSKNYKRLNDAAVAMVHLSSIKIMLNRF